MTMCFLFEKASWWMGGTMAANTTVMQHKMGVLSVILLKVRRGA